MTKRTGAVAVGLVAFVLGGVAAQFVPRVYAQAADIKSPKWQHGLMVRVRAGDEKDFTDKTKKIGIEVYRDDNNGNLIYVSESGAIAVVPGK